MGETAPTNFPVLTLYSGAIKALFRRYYGSIQALLALLVFSVGGGGLKAYRPSSGGVKGFIRPW